MICLTQTRTGFPAGNCTETSMACILELPVEVLPPLWSRKTGRSEATWCRLHTALRDLGYVLVWADIELQHTPVRFNELWPWHPAAAFPEWRSFHLLGGPNPDELSHCVVGYNGEMFWDPNPRRRGIVAVDGIGALVPIDRVRQMRSLFPEVETCYGIQLRIGGPGDV